MIPSWSGLGLYNHNIIWLTIQTKKKLIKAADVSWHQPRRHNFISSSNDWMCILHSEYVWNILNVSWRCIEFFNVSWMCKEPMSIQYSEYRWSIFWMSFCQAQVQIQLRSRSSSGPGPFLVHSRSILSHSNLFQFKIRWSGPGADAIFTVPPTTHPVNFSGGDPGPKSIQIDF